MQITLKLKKMASANNVEKTGATGSLCAEQEEGRINGVTN